MIGGKRPYGGLRIGRWINHQGKADVRALVQGRRPVHEVTANGIRRTGAAEHNHSAGGNSGNPFWGGASDGRAIL